MQKSRLPKLRRRGARLFSSRDHLYPFPFQPKVDSDTSLSVIPQVTDDTQSWLDQPLTVINVFCTDFMRGKFFPSPPTPSPSGRKGAPPKNNNNKQRKGWVDSLGLWLEERSSAWVIREGLSCRRRNEGISIVAGNILVFCLLFFHPLSRLLFSIM
ncbi:hypothetical protein CEXT_201901 [Caerostris extrusa]|uniref:Uncharacterized protein n=1 Tax=Caerostris extrusa TaxID=172846 RepID=A0AAV4T746_CAEEX|nr:hypothetical protein CEXT_201901 [Caerostris extrusa]